MENLWHKEALFSGVGGNGFKLGTVLTRGWFWVRGSGCSLLYRGRALWDIDFNDILGVYELGAEEIKVPGYIGYWGGDKYIYNLRRADGCGRCGRTFKASVTVELDSFGQLVEGRCNSVFEIYARQVSGGRVELMWSYFPWRQGALPRCFRVYGDNGTGQISYDQPLGEIGYDGRKFYDYRTDGLDGVRYQFEVRALNSDMIENEGFARAEVYVKTEKPVCVEVIGVEQL